MRIRSFACGFAILTGGCVCSVQRIETQTLPDATVGQSYTFEMEQNCSGAGGLGDPGEEEWQIEGDVPSGIRLGREGRFSGVPSMAGTYIVRIVLFESDFTGDYVRDARAFELRVNPGQANAEPPTALLTKVAAAPGRQIGGCV